MNCPTCERHPDYDDGPMAICTDPLHDLADRCEELLGIGKHQIRRAEEAEAMNDALLEALENLKLQDSDGGPCYCRYGGPSLYEHRSPLHDDKCKAAREAVDAARGSE